MAYRLPPDDEELIRRTLQAESAKRGTFQASATPELAARVGQIHTMYPGLPAGAKLAMAKAGMSDETIAKIYPAASKAVVQQSVQPKKQKSWFQRNIADKFKTGTRYGFAALNFPLDMVQGAFAQIFDPNDSIDGWFISTDLGSLIANDEEAGSGFFIGGRAKELQAERARRYRGTVGGHAWTIGRGLASVVSKPDSTAFNIISGMFDAAAAVLVPTVPGAGQAKQAITGAAAAGRGGRAVSTAATVIESVGRGSETILPTRLTAQEIDDIRKGVIVGNQVDYKAANRWFGTGQARRIIERTAETDNFLDVWDLWGRKIDPDLALTLAREKDPTAIKNILLDKLGQSEGLANSRNFKGGDRAYLSLARRDKILNNRFLFGQGARLSRAYATMPKRNFNLFQAEDPREQAETLRTVENILKVALVDRDTTRTLMNRAGELITTKDRPAIETFLDDFDQVVRRSATRAQSKGVQQVAPGNLQTIQGATVRTPKVGQYVVGPAGKGYIKAINKTASGRIASIDVDYVDEVVDRRIVDAIFDGQKRTRESTIRNNIDDAGDATDDGFYKTTFGGVDPDAPDTVFVGPQLASEFMRHEYFFPDVRQIRRLTASRPFATVFVKGADGADPNLAKLASAGQLRMPFAAISYVQEQLWRPLITATIGNAVRNILDSQVMMAMSHKPVATIVRHPFQYIMLMAKERQFADVMGRNLSDFELPGALGVAQRNYKRAVSEELTSHHRDPLVPYRKMQRLGSWTVRERGLDSVDDVVRAHGDEIGKLNDDWAARMLATEIPGGNGATYSPQMLIQMVRRGDEEAVEWYEEMAAYYKAGRKTYNTVKREFSSASVDLSDDLNLEALLRETQDRLMRMTGGNDDLMHIVSQGRLREIRTVQLDNVKSTSTGGLVVIEEGGERYTARYIGDNPQGGIDVQPFAFVEAESTRALSRFLSRPSIYDDPAMPRRVAGEVLDPTGPAAENMKANFDRLLDSFFGFIYQKRTAKWERNPLFRQLYGQQLEILAPSLDMPSVKAIIADISKRAADEGRRAEDYLGKTVWQKLLDIESGKVKSYGTINREELNAYATGVVLDEMKDMLYNAAERKNFTDGMRILSPFLQQQVEFLGRLGRTAFSPIQGGEFGYVPNLNVMRKTQLAVSGTTEADPDGNGRGFFYTDPTTGAWTFTIPLSGQLTKLLTGVEAPLNAQVKGLALGLDYRPGLGPFATIAASKILPDIPSTDMMRSFLLPYGERQGASEALLPSWFRKVADGLTGYEGSGVYANTYVETMQALAATGEYNTADPNDRDRLFEDARKKAQILTVLRGFQQFAGPAAGSFDYVVKSGEVDVYASQLSKALRELQEQDYDTAVINFVDIFGEEAFAYLGNKTRSVLGGLEATDVFNDFERTNEQLFRQYPDVAGFFAPSGTDFNFAVYQRQLSKGARKKLTAEEVLEEAEKNIAFAYYKAVRREFPVNTNEDEQAYLRTYRQKLEARFPGYAKQVFDPQKLPRAIDQLTMAAQRSDLDKNPVALAVRYYSEVRLRALEEANARGLAGFSAQSAADLREYLHNYGLALSQRYPEFARVYDRLLSREVEK